MVKLFIKKLITLSIFTAALYSCLPDSGAGRFAKHAIELLKLAILLAAILEMVR